MTKAQKKKNRKKIIIFSVIGVLLIVVAVMIIAGGNKELIIPVQQEEVKLRTITEVVTATGKINPVEQVAITPEVNGEIVELPVEEGDVVRKGQLLIRIKPDIYVAQRNRAQANLQSSTANLKVREASLDQVKSEYERIKGLFDKKLSSDSQLEAAKANFLQNQGLYEAQKAAVLQAQEALKEAEENLARTAIYSPLNGTVSALHVELGERVLGSNFTQGTNIMTVADLEQMEATVEVDENDVVKVAVGDTSWIEVDAFGDKKFLGLVTQIGNSAKQSGLGTQDEIVNFEIKIQLNKADKGIRPGMSCDADIETETRANVLSVPIQSVTARVLDAKTPKEDEQNADSRNEAISVKKDNGIQRTNKPKEIVFIVEDNVVKMREVATGISDDTYLEITTGLKEGEKVVSGPYRAISSELEDGKKVMIEKKNEGGKPEVKSN